MPNKAYRFLITSGGAPHSLLWGAPPTFDLGTRMLSNLANRLRAMARAVFSAYDIGGSNVVDSISGCLISLVQI